MKRVLAGLLLALLAVAGYVMFRPSGDPAGETRAKTPPQRPPVPVETVEVARAPIEEVTRLTGEVRPAYRYIVSPRIGGRVLSLTKRVGDAVAAGEVVARIDDSEYRQAVAEAEAGLRISEEGLNRTRTELALAAQSLERMQALEQKKFVSRQDLDRARAEHEGLSSQIKLAEAQVAQRQAALETARIRLGYAVITAPQAGLVAERPVDEGGMVVANGPLLTVIGIDPAIVAATVTEGLYGRIGVGQGAQVEFDALPGRNFAGRISRVAPQFDEQSRTAVMEIEVPNAGGIIKPGMFARVRLVLARKQDAQLVPTAALVVRNGGNAVFLVDETGAARRVEVTTGIATAAVTEIISPTLTGRVVVAGQHLLEDGSKVVVRDREAAPARGGGNGAGRKDGA